MNDNNNNNNPNDPTSNNQNPNNLPDGADLGDGIELPPSSVDPKDDTDVTGELPLPPQNSPDSVPGNDGAPGGTPDGNSGDDDDDDDDDKEEPAKPKTPLFMTSVNSGLREQAMRFLSTVGSFADVDDDDDDDPIDAIPPKKEGDNTENGEADDDSEDDDDDDDDDGKSDDDDPEIINDRKNAEINLRLQKVRFVNIAVFRTEGVSYGLDGAPVDQRNLLRERGEHPVLSNIYRVPTMATVFNDFKLMNLNSNEDPRFAVLEAAIRSGQTRLKPADLLAMKLRALGQYNPNDFLRWDLREKIPFGSALTPNLAQGEAFLGAFLTEVMNPMLNKASSGQLGANFIISGPTGGKTALMKALHKQLLFMMSAARAVKTNSLAELRNYAPSLPTAKWAVELLTSRNLEAVKPAPSDMLWLSALSEAERSEIAYVKMSEAVPGSTFGSIDEYAALMNRILNSNEKIFFVDSAQSLAIEHGSKLMEGGIPRELFPACRQIAHCASIGRKIVFVNLNVMVEDDSSSPLDVLGELDPNATDFEKTAYEREKRSQAKLNAQSLKRSIFRKIVKGLETQTGSVLATEVEGQLTPTKTPNLYRTNMSVRYAIRPGRRDLFSNAPQRVVFNHFAEDF